MQALSRYVRVTTRLPTSLTVTVTDVRTSKILAEFTDTDEQDRNMEFSVDLVCSKFHSSPLSPNPNILDMVFMSALLWNKLFPWIST